MLQLSTLRRSTRFRHSQYKITGACHISPSNRHTSLYLLKRMSQVSTDTVPLTPYKASEDLKQVPWPEENLALDVDKGGGFYPAKLGEVFDDGRFVITRKLGWGGFSNVWLAHDSKGNRHVALKILSVHASKKVDAGRLRELSILRAITTAGPSHRGFPHVIHLLHEFTFESFYGKHICFVTNVLSFSVPDMQKHLSDPRLPLKFILRIVKHVLKALEYLHDTCGVVHSDLKPSNILLLPCDVESIIIQDLIKNPSALYDIPRTIPPNEFPFHPVASSPIFYYPDTNPSAELHWVIADFGHAHLHQEHLANIVQPYALRAPEVVLGLEWGPAIEIWNLGCLMYEWASDKWLFNPKERDGLSRDLVHLAQMMERTDQHHEEANLQHYALRHGLQDVPELLAKVNKETENKETIRIVDALTEKKVRCNTSAEEVDAFVSLMLRFLKLNPVERPTAAQALNDPVFEHV